MITSAGWRHLFPPSGGLVIAHGAPVPRSQPAEGTTTATSLPTESGRASRPGVARY